MGNCYAAVAGDSSDSIPDPAKTEGSRHNGGMLVERFHSYPTNGLIPGLMDDLALQCLARIPLALRGSPRLVCKSWRDALHSRQLAELRRVEGVQESFLCLCLENKRRAIVCKLLDWRLGRILKLPPLDVELSENEDCWCTWVGPDLVLGLGKRVPRRQEVWAYSTLENLWRCLPPIEGYQPLVACTMLQQVLMVGMNKGIKSQGELSVRTLDLISGTCTQRGPLLPWLDSFDILSCWGDRESICVLRGHVVDGVGEREFHIDKYFLDSRGSESQWTSLDKVALPNKLTLSSTWWNHSQCPAGAVVNGLLIGLWGPISEYKGGDLFSPRSLECMKLTWFTSLGERFSQPLLNRRTKDGTLEEHSSIESNWHPSALGKLQKRVGQWGPFVNGVMALPWGLLVVANFVTRVRVLGDSGAFFLSQEELYVNEISLSSLGQGVSSSSDNVGQCDEYWSTPDGFERNGRCFQISNLGKLSYSRMAIVTF